MDIRLHYEERGAGDALILLHGNGENGSYFVHQMEAFSARYRVIAPDTRGHGKSPRGEGAFSISRFAEDLREFMDGLGLEKASILGFSDGGNIALTFALRYPERVDKLVLNGANLHPRGVKAAVQIPIVWNYKRALRRAETDPKAAAEAEMLGLMVKEPDIPVTELLKLHMPTLVIAGTRDMIREKHTRLIHAGIPGAKLVLLPGDHFIAAKEPEAFNKAVLAFLNGEMQ